MPLCSSPIPTMDFAAGTTAIFAKVKHTKLPALTSTWSQIQPELLYLCPSNSFIKISTIRNGRLRSKRRSLYLVRCSTKPDTDRAESLTDENSHSNASLNSGMQEQEASAANNKGSASNSSFSKGLVFGLGLQGSWDNAEIGSPVVKRYLGDEEERWYMWYHGSSKGNPSMDSIGLAVSSNGIHWERGEATVKSSNDVGLTLNCSDDWWAFDTQGIRPCEVVIMSSTKVRANNALYWLYYTGYNAEKVDSLDSSLQFNISNPEILNSGANSGAEGDIVSRISKSLPGLAMSQDGRHWARIEGEHHSGALFDVGSKGEWDSTFIASPQVVYHRAGDVRMYYHSFDVENGHFAVGMARSRDGIKWVKLGKIIGGGSKGMFDELGVINAYIVKNKKDGKYVMAYEGVAGNGRRSIGMAVSDDGLKRWRKLQDWPVLMPSEEAGSWDAEGVGSPCLVQIEGDGAVDEWRLYYRGFDREGKTGIGLAVSHGCEFCLFQRWKGFHL
ncbi:OLC1v1032738C1 [Oldenlandia corymbosa var. corymbosa]|uniref:OLC1v1032738C1 n=1 Tax=Oldenlandia corymbosa var. corymbosa TaxID=529605 RepID=A0AAV1CLI8_OLDCO|nr:OLC1v1032738C1 [Oldenlandia corymbosa var. corymbosa]